MIGIQIARTGEDDVTLIPDGIKRIFSRLKTIELISSKDSVDKRKSHIRQAGFLSVVV